MTWLGFIIETLSSLAFFFAVITAAAHLLFALNSSDHGGVRSTFDWLAVIVSVALIALWFPATKQIIRWDVDRVIAQMDEARR